MAKKIYEGMSFSALCKKYLKEGADIAELATDEVAAPAEHETAADEFDAEMEAPADEFDAEDEVAAEGDVTVTLSADLVAALRSILALVDGESAEDEVAAEDLAAEDDELGAEDDVEVDDSEDEIDLEDETEEEGIFEEDEEEAITADVQGVAHADITSPKSAPNRKKGAPAVNRKGAGEGDFSKVSGREGEGAEVSSATSAPNRKKGAPAVDRSGSTAAHKATGKKMLDINR